MRVIDFFGLVVGCLKCYVLEKDDTSNNEQIGIVINDERLGHRKGWSDDRLVLFEYRGGGG